MYLHRLISALAFVSMVLAAAVPSPGSPTADAHQPLALPSNDPQLSSENEKTIVVTFSQNSADSKWTEITQDNAKACVIELLHQAHQNYGFQHVTLKNVEFRGFASGDIKRKRFTIQFLRGILVHLGVCNGWVLLDFEDYEGRKRAVLSGSIEDQIHTSMSSIQQYRYGIARS
ncbi:hypothetical protein HHX47_DHR9000021 [Lentinula edodes]|nr:hypothetical protein HHX47_DHR9000021 [Lentinula edodes]